MSRFGCQSFLRGAGAALLSITCAAGDAGCTLDTNGTGELLGSSLDSGADALTQPDSPVAPDTSWPDAAVDQEVASDAGDALADGAGDVAQGPEAGDDADAAEEEDAAQDADAALDAEASDDVDAPDDAQDEGDVSVLDAADCDAGSCVADAGDDASEAGAEGGVNVCDLDGDGALNPTCGGDDCCDSDANVHTGQASFFSTPNACGNFDYNCDGTQEKRWTAVGSSCHLCYLFACCADDGDYLSGPPDCGQQAEVGGCGGWPDCNNNGGYRTQQCR